MIKHIKAFINGIREYRYDVTTHYPEPYIESYDKGRALAWHIKENLK